MSDLQKPLEILISKFQSQRTITHNLWALYTVTTFTASAFSFRYGAKFPSSIIVMLGFLAFTLGHAALVRQSIVATNAIADSIKEIAKDDKSALSRAGVKIADTANPIWVSMVLHSIIDICVSLLILFA